MPDIGEAAEIVSGQWTSVSPLSEELLRNRLRHKVYWEVALLEFIPLNSFVLCQNQLRINNIHTS